MREIYKKYKKHFDSAINDKCVSGLEYSDLMVILRAVEKKLDKDIPMQFGCPSCVLDLLELFYNLMPNVQERSNVKK